MKITLIEDYVPIQDLPEVARERLVTRGVGEFFSADTPDTLMELKALYRAMEALVEPAIDRVRKSSIDNEKIVDSTHRRTMREVVADSLPMVDHNIEKATNHLYNLIDSITDLQAYAASGVRNADKLKLQQALPTAFTKDIDSMLKQMEQAYGVWATKLGEQLNQHREHFDKESTALIESAVTIARHAAKRCASMEVGPSVEHAR